MIMGNQNKPLISWLSHGLKFSFAKSVFKHFYLILFANEFLVKLELRFTVKSD